MLKNFFLIFIAVVIPLFFLFVFLSSAWNRLASLRTRGRQLRERFDELSQRRSASAAARAVDSPPTDEGVALAEELTSVRQAYQESAQSYARERSGFPGRLLVRWGRFDPVEPLSEAK